MTTIEMQVTEYDGYFISLVSEEGHECNVSDTSVGSWQPKPGDSVMVEPGSDEYPLRVWRDGVLVWGEPAQTLEEALEDRDKVLLGFALAESGADGIVLHRDGDDWSAALESWTDGPIGQMGRGPTPLAAVTAALEALSDD